MQLGGLKAAHFRRRFHTPICLLLLEVATFIFHLVAQFGDDITCAHLENVVGTERMHRLTN